MDTEHAARMRQALINENADLAQQNPRYVMRITGDDAEGSAQLGNFIDPEATYPVIVTTSRLLSTGVDAQTCRLIVLDREVGSMTEFKQIVGRGTRVHEDTKKYYFTLIDFRKATNHFADPDFDGEPVQIYEPGEDDPVTPPDDVPPTDDGDDAIPPEPGEDETIVVDPTPPDITMPPGMRGDRASITSTAMPVTVLAERVEYLDEDGKLVTESLRDYTAEDPPQALRQPRRVSHRWKAAERKQAIIEELAAEGLLLEPLAEEVGKDLDPFDLICHVAFDQPPLTRRERADNVRKRDVFTKYGPQARAVLEALLAQISGRRRRHRPRRPAHPAESRRSTRWAPRSQLIKQFGARDRLRARRARTPSRSLSRRPPERSCPSRNTVKSIQDIMRQDVGVDGDAQRISQLCWMFFLKIIDDQDQELELMQDDYRSPIPEAPAVAHLGRRPRGHHRRRRCWPSSTTSSSRSSRNCPSAAPRRTAAASCATCSRTPTTT